MSGQNQIQTCQQKRNYVSRIIYKAPKKYHDKIVQINKQTSDLFMEHGALMYEVFQISRDNTFECEGMVEITNIANLISVDQDEELWIEMHSYRDIEHAKEFMAKCENDVRIQPLYKQFIMTITQETKIVIGDFNRIRF